MQDVADDSAPNLVDRLRRAAVDHGCRPASRRRDTTLTWSQLDAPVTVVAHAPAAPGRPTVPAPRSPSVLAGDPPHADGRRATGDVAYVDADLHLVDRLGELITVTGFNVHPREAEAVLAAHPGVAESAVPGVPHPRTGETVRTYVVPAPGHPVTGEELLAHRAT
ncbi:hypothetical protein [Micromonospora sp. NPDC001898]|uniref:AMP-binding enzyme n=1 Tax=Micromonospora sp. NPDC001898 TaxID=3364221 RepID=UPI00368F0BD1